LNPLSKLQNAFASFCLPLLATGVLALAAGPAQAVESDETQALREWSYREYADVVTGQKYPAALLMSPRPVEASSNAADMGHGYLSVENYAKRPMEVTLSWDEPTPRTPAVHCKSSGCEVTVRFGAGPSTRLIAFQGKHSPSLALQDGRGFVAQAGRHVGAIEIQVQTLTHGSITLRFSTARRLQADKLGRPAV
jgi:hypothetical protein